MGDGMNGIDWTASVTDIYKKIADTLEDAKKSMGTVNLLVTGKNWL